LENVDIFYGHLEYFMEIWDILWPFGTFCIHLVHFFPFWYHVPRKIWQPLAVHEKFIANLIPLSLSKLN
jgi:hypothetical protein